MKLLLLWQGPIAGQGWALHPAVGDKDFRKEMPFAGNFWNGMLEIESDRVEQSGIPDPARDSRVRDYLATGHSKGVNNSGNLLSVCFPTCSCNLWHYGQTWLINS